MSYSDDEKQREFLEMLSEAEEKGLKIKYVRLIKTEKQ